MAKSFDEIDDAAPGKAGASLGGSGGTQAFVWPPKSGGKRTGEDRGHGEDLSPSDGRGQAGGLASAGKRELARGAWPSWMQAIEQFWLPRTSLPLGERLEQAGTAVDDLRAFCHRCGKAVGPFDADDTGCSQCRGTSLAWDRLIRLGSYSGVWKRVVRDVKFHQQAAVGAAAGVMLARQVQASGVLDLAGEHEVLVVPVPMNPWRRLARGVDHARMIAASVAQSLDAPLVTPMGKEYRSEQAFLSATDRRSNLRGAMYLKRRNRRLPSLERGVTIILVDDVKTTGSTLKEACRVLRMWHAERSAGQSGGQVRPKMRPHRGVEGASAADALVIVGAVVAVSERGRV